MMVDKRNVSLFLSVCQWQLLNSVAQGFFYQHDLGFAIPTLKASSKSPVLENDLTFYAIFKIRHLWTTSAVGNQGTKCEIMISIFSINDARLIHDFYLPLFHLLLGTLLSFFLKLSRS